MLVGSKIKIFENSDLFTHLSLYDILEIFGEDKEKTSQAVKFMLPVKFKFMSPEKIPLAP